MPLTVSHRAKIIAAFAAIYVVWGSTYLAIRIAVETLPPLVMGGTRFLVAGGILYALARARGVPRPRPSHWLLATAIGTLLLLGGNGAVVGVAHLVPTWLSALLIATVPFFMVGLEWAFAGGPRPGLRVVLGLALGFAGLALLILPAGGAGQTEFHVGAALVLLGGALSWAVGSLWSRSASLPDSSILSIGITQLGGGAVMLVVGLLAGERLDPAAVSSRSALAFVYLVSFGSLVGFTCYLWLLGETQPARVATYAYVNPVIAVLLGWSLGGETITAHALLAAAVIVAAVVLITTAPSRRPRSAGAVGSERAPPRAVRVPASRGPVRPGIGVPLAGAKAKE